MISIIAIEAYNDIIQLNANKAPIILNPYRNVVLSLANDLACAIRHDSISTNLKVEKIKHALNEAIDFYLETCPKQNK